MDNSAVGMRIKEGRKKKKLTQQQLADQIGKTESSIRKYEKGLVEIPTNVLVKLANVLGVNAHVLMGGSPDSISIDLYGDVLYADMCHNLHRLAELSDDSTADLEDSMMTFIKSIVSCVDEYERGYKEEIIIPLSNLLECINMLTCPVMREADKYIDLINEITAFINFKMRYVNKELFTEEDSSNQQNRSADFFSHQ